MELEVNTDEPPMFFYANRESGELWEAPFEAGNPLNEATDGKLALFVPKE